MRRYGTAYRRIFLSRARGTDKNDESYSGANLRDRDGADIGDGSDRDGGAPLATVLPAGSRLEGRLLVPSRAIAFVAVGQKVLLRVDAFPYQKFGQVEAVVAAVEQAPISDGAGAPTLYRVTVRPERQSID